MDWNKHHTQSEKYAIQAEIVLRNGDFDDAAKQYRLAAEEEILALATLDPKKIRTAGILAVSAASLWYKAKEFKKARRVANKWLGCVTESAASQLQVIFQIALTRGESKDASARQYKNE